MKKNILAIILSTAFIFFASAQEVLNHNQINFKSFSHASAKFTKELDSLTNNEFKKHPEYGILPFNAPCKDCFEILQKRDKRHRYFIKEGSNGNEFYSQSSSGDMNYIDTLGNLRTIDYRLKQDFQKGVFSASDQPFPVTINLNKRYASIMNAGKELLFNREISLFIKKMDGTLESLGKPSWTNYTAGDNGVVVHNIYPGIDLEMQLGEGKTESFYRINRPLNFNGASLIIHDNILLPKDFVCDYSYSSKNSDSLYEGPVCINNESGKRYFIIGNPAAYDENGDENDHVIGLPYASNDSGNYDLYISLDWMNSSKRSYPIIIDPFIAASDSQQTTVNSSGYDSICFANGCTSTINLTIPGRSSVTNLSYSFTYQALGTCNENQGAFDINSGGCRSPGTSGNWHTCQIGLPGLCVGQDVSIYGDVQTCVPAAQCSDYTIPFSLTFYRCVQKGTSCAFSCINGNTPWTMTATGRNIKVSAQPVSVCQGSTVSITAIADSGVAPYAYTWSPGGINGQTINVSPTTTTTYTVTASDCNGADNSQATSTVTIFHCPPVDSIPPANYVIKQNYPSASCAEPIDLATGSYAYTHRDLKMNAVNGIVDFTRFYNSINASVSSSLGNGWSHNFNFYLTNYADTLWRIHYGDGHNADFIPYYSTAGLDSAVAVYGGTYEVLKRNVSNRTFTLKFKNQDIYNFNSSGVLTSISDRNGNITLFTYTGSNLTQITLLGGRKWKLVYTSGRITSISDTLGRTVNYTYDANANLITVKDAASHSTTFTYNTNHQITQITLPKGNILITNTFNASSRVIKQVDALNNSTTIAYDTINHTATVTYPGGATKIFYSDSYYRLIRETDELGFNKYYSYDVNNNRTSFTNENGNVTTYGYDGMGNLVTIQQPLNVNTFFAYSSTNDVLTQTDALNYITTYARDANGNLTGVAYPNGTSKTFVVNSLGQNTEYLDGLNHTTIYSYNSSGDLTSETRPNGTYTYTYDNAGRKWKVTDPNSKSVSYAYENDDNQTSIADALSQAITFQYDANNNLTSKTDKKGLQTIYSYDTKDRLSTALDANSHTKTFTYDSRDNLSSVIDENAHTTTYAYDAKNRKISVTNALSSVAQYQYDGVGNLLSSTDANGVATINVYDALNRKTSVSNSLSQATSYSYDADGRIIQKTDPLGRTASYVYDKIGLLKQVTDEAGKLTNYSYDANWNNDSIQDPNGHKQSIHFDNANRPDKFTDAGGNVLTRSYDAANNITSVVMPDGVTKSITYDNIYRPSSVSYSTGENYSFNYDADDNITSTVCSTGTESFQYDNLNRRTQFTDVFGNAVSFSYDAVGNRTGVNYPGNKQVSYQYNALNEMTSLSDWMSHQTMYSYDGTGRMLNMTYPNGIKCNYSYDLANRLIQLSQYVVSPLDTVFSTTIALDANGNRTQEIKSGVPLPNINPQTYSYSYTSADLLTNSGVSQFTNDADGNRLSQTTGGNITSFSFTANDLLHSITTGSNTTLFAYDAFGNRLSRSVNGSQTKFVLDLSGSLSQVLQEQNSSGKVNANYIYGIGLVERIDSSGKALYYHHDAEGNTVALTNDSQRVTDTYIYEPFGRILNHTGNTAQRYCFLGKYGVQAESDSLYFVRARYYDAVAGRFFSKDVYPVAFNNPLSINRFVYGFNNPLSYKDYSGLFGNRDNATMNLVEKSGELDGLIADIANELLDPISYKYVQEEMTVIAKYVDNASSEIETEIQTLKVSSTDVIDNSATKDILASVGLYINEIELYGDIGRMDIKGSHVVGTAIALGLTLAIGTAAAPFAFAGGIVYGIAHLADGEDMDAFFNENFDSFNKWSSKKFYDSLH